jgi:PAS domain S-box-containing protein
MNGKRARPASITERFILIGLGLAVIFWILESAIHVFIFEEGNFIQQISTPAPHEIWMRLFVVAMFVAFAIYTQFIVNQRRQAQQATKIAHAEINQIFQTAADGMRVIDKDFTVLRVNETLSTLCGVSKDEAVGKKCYEVFPGPVCHTPKCPMVRILEGDERVETDLEKVRKDGKKIPCIVTAQPFRGPSGDLIGIVEDFKDITERKEAEGQVRTSLREKDILLQEIHHRVKNNLQIISSLLKLQAGYIQDKSYADMFEESQNRIRSMAFVHERLYQGKDITSVASDEYIKDVVNALFRSYGVNPERITLKVDIGDVVLGISSAVPCGLIINELVSNALKFAFPQDRKGEIQVGLHPTDKDEILLTVSDNGVGMPEDLDHEDAKSLGLKLVKILTDQIGGRLQINRNEGTKFQIKFRA